MKLSPGSYRNVFWWSEELIRKTWVTQCVFYVKKHQCFCSLSVWITDQMKNHQILLVYSLWLFSLYFKNTDSILLVESLLIFLSSMVFWLQWSSFIFLNFERIHLALSKYSGAISDTHICVFSFEDRNFAVLFLRLNWCCCSWKFPTSCFQTICVEKNIYSTFLLWYWGSKLKSVHNLWYTDHFSL